MAAKQLSGSGRGERLARRAQQLALGALRERAQLARLVSDLWHECGPVEGTGDPPVLIRNAWADLVAKPIEDPGLKRPYATCYVEVLGGAEPKGVVPMT